MFKITKQVWVINYDHELISNRPGFPVPGIPVPGLAILSYPGPGPGPGQVTFFIPVPVPVKCWFIIPVPVPVNSGFLVPVPVPVRPKIMSRSITGQLPQDLIYRPGFLSEMQNWFKNMHFCLPRLTAGALVTLKKMHYERVKDD